LGFGWVGVAAEEFFGVVGVVDFGWFVPRKREVPPAVGPGQAAGVGDGGLVVTVSGEAVVGRAGEEQGVGVGGAAGGPVRAVVDLAVVAGLNAIRTRAAAVAGVADDALVGGGDAVLAAQIEGSFAVINCRLWPY
jgi:hypothetical protein